MVLNLSTSSITLLLISFLTISCSFIISAFVVDRSFSFVLSSIIFVFVMVLTIACSNSLLLRSIFSKYGQIFSIRVVAGSLANSEW